MVGAVLLCLISSVTFCLCARFLIQVIGSATRGGFAVQYGQYSSRARRLARTYFVSSLVLLMALAFFGAIKSYIDLFSL